MDFEKAIAAHANWKVKLRTALESGSQLDAGAICSDKNCDLGRWLHGDGKRAFGASPTFLKCVEAHATFHREAGAAAEAINRRDDRAESMLGMGSRFGEASMDVAVALRRLRKEVEVA